MQREKRILIIAEIEQWRKTKMLPEQYCDFLLNLYLQDEKDRPPTKVQQAIANVKGSDWKIWLAVCSALALVSFIGLNFIVFPLPMQIAAASALVVWLYWIGGKQRAARPLLSYFAFGAGNALLLLFGLVIAYVHDAEEAVIWTVIGGCGAFWMLVGASARIGLYHYCGWLLLFALYGHLLFRFVGPLDWFGLQMAWLPLCVVLSWLGWLMHHKQKAVGAVFLLAGFTAWFLPELYGLIYDMVPGNISQVSLFAKLAAAAVLLFTTRKTWTEWVA